MFKRMDTPTTIKLSVGICALNEEANIGRLLHALGTQRREGFILEEIIINSDGSTDGTAQQARNSAVVGVEVWERNERKGKSYRQREIFQNFRGDVLLMLDADILPADEFFLERLLAPILSGQEVGLVSCPLRALSPQTMVERLVNVSVTAKERLLQQNNAGDNIFACHGPVRLFSRQLIAAYGSEDVVSEDAYSYLLCKKIGLPFVYVTTTFVWFRSPQTLADYRKQGVRFRLGQKELGELFGVAFVEEMHRVPLKLVLTVGLQTLFRHPFYAIGFACLLASVQVVHLFQKDQPLTWSMAASSKKL